MRGLSGHCLHPYIKRTPNLSATRAELARALLNRKLEVFVNGGHGKRACAELSTKPSIVKYVVARRSESILAPSQRYQFGRHGPRFANCSIEDRAHGRQQSWICDVTVLPNSGTNPCSEHAPSSQPLGGTSPNSAIHADLE